MSKNIMKVKRSIERYAPGLGAKIKQAREADKRSVETLCGLAEISRVYWNERIRGSLPEETLRRIERVLGIDLGVDFEEPLAS